MILRGKRNLPHFTTIADLHQKVCGNAGLTPQFVKILLSQASKAPPGRAEMKRQNTHGHSPHR
jgi:hypothetical protein